MKNVTLTIGHLHRTAGWRETRVHLFVDERGVATVRAEGRTIGTVEKDPAYGGWMATEPAAFGGHVQHNVPTRKGALKFLLERDTCHNDD